MYVTVIIVNIIRITLYSRGTKKLKRRDKEIMLICLLLIKGATILLPS